MHHMLFALIFTQPLFLGTFGSPESCYYCTGTPQCGDPIDYNEVSPRDCLENSVCLKYISTSKNLEGEVVAHELTYRKCFEPVLDEEDTCTFVKNTEEEALDKLNHSLVWFECSVCDSTNCNPAFRVRGLFSTWITSFLIFLNILPLL